MKNIILALFTLCFAFNCFAQQLRYEIKDNKELIELRQELDYADSLMKEGIFLDEKTKRNYFTGYSYRRLYDWDQYFEAIVQIYMGWSDEYIKNGVTIFLDYQKESGLITRSVTKSPTNEYEHVKPFLAQITLLVFDNYDDTRWFSDDYFNKMKKYLDYWMNDMDINKNGLSEWMSAPHSGMDNQHERAGWWNDRISEGVDLNSYLVREIRAFAKIAEIMGKKKIAKEYLSIAEARAQTIRELLWDEEDGFFYDLYISNNIHGIIERETGKPIKVKSIAGFTPMWAGIATEEQARELIHNHLMNPNEFWTTYPIPALAKSEPGYMEERMLSDLGCSWRANTWIPTNYMVYHSLKNYGYNDLATLIAVRTNELLNKAGDREYYTSETGVGQGLDPFWGWSLLGHFFMFEEDAEFDITNFNGVTN